MATGGPNQGHEPPQAWAPARVQHGGQRRTIALAALPLIGLVAAVGIALLAPATPRDELPGASGPAMAAGPGEASPDRASPGPDDSLASPSGGPSSGHGSPAASAAPWVPGPPGRIAYVEPTGRLAVIDDETGETQAIPIPGIVTGPPAWSPDGTRMAVIVTDPEATRLYVVALPDGGAGDPVAKVVSSSGDRRPFYLYWAPDGERIGFLANDRDAITLRIARPDGTEPVDGPTGDGVLRRGAPLYFTWSAADRLLLHVGAGPDAFAGEIGLDGGSAGPAVPGTGDFRVAAASRDATTVAYLAGGTAPAVVVEARDGTGGGRVPVFGPAAFAFDPVGSTLAMIGADAPGASPVEFPLGPLRLLDPVTGGVRTLIEGSVIAFYWSPDGRTIAALRLAPAGAALAAARPGAALAAAQADPMAASPEPAPGVRLTFVDVASAEVRSDRAVRLGADFVTAVLPYFDQYALSHRVWSPDGRAIVLPLEDDAGRTHATVLDADGAAPRPIAEARQAFWAP